MAIYQRLLCVVDLLEDAPAVAGRAAQLARSCGARLDLLHVFEFVPVEPMGETLMPAVQIEEELIERARQRLAALAADLGLTDCESDRHRQPRAPWALDPRQLYRRYRPARRALRCARGPCHAASQCHG
jgi:nucleotide-binding universal stress UspA family protein